MSDIDSPRQRVLAIVSKFEPHHLAYLKALAKHVDLVVATNGEGNRGLVQQACEEGLQVTRIGRIGLQKVEARLHKTLATWRPRVVHTLYFYNEELTIMVRRLVGTSAIVVHECRDPLTTLLGMTKLRLGSDPWLLEREALRSSDGQIFVTQAVRTYLEEIHRLDFSETSLIVPHCFAEHTVAAPRQKLSVEDGRVHLALVGSMSAHPDHGRYYGDIIRRLVSLGFVVHSHFHNIGGISNQFYRDLSTELEDYYYHEPISIRKGTRYSEALSEYDLMGVFHELDATRHNESEILAMCMPTKAVSGWLCGGIPTVCFPHYKGVLEPVREFGVGFVAESWEDLPRIVQDRAAIARATEACLAHRYRFTAEWNAERVVAFYKYLLARSESK